GGYTVSVLRRAAQFRRFGAVSPLLLTVDLTADYGPHRAGFIELGLADESTVIRNLFEEALADPGWVWAAADPTIVAPTTEVDVHSGGSGILTLRTPRVARPDWHRSAAPLLVLRDGEVVGGFEGFGGLYRAWVSHVIAGLDPDLPTVIIAESRQVGELLWPLRSDRVRLVHTVHSAHTMPPHEWDSPVDELWGGWLDELGRYDAVVFPTVGQRDDVARRFGEATRLEVIPHALESAVDSTLADSSEFDPRLVVMVTRLVPLKRVDHVIRAVAALRERGVAARLEVLGEGPAQGDLEALIAELGVSDAVVLRGHVPDPAAHVARAAVSVLSSTYEGQPLAVLESLMQGVPVVAYDINYGPRDMIDHGENGLLVPAGDVNALTDALGRVLDDPELRSRLAVGARTTAARLGPSAVMQRWGALFRDVLP
ncbi:MAG TPA: glycosyltransferase, partial [Terrimesophilobacter sp.]|nr:glycosyltransferase [Terrimesophilobacter sp.]